MNRRRPLRRAFLAVPVAAAFLLGVSSALLGTCGPFTDTAADAFCPLILEIFTLGITTGTTPTTFDPASTVNRTQMAAFLSRSVDTTLRRGSRRAALNQFWTSQSVSSFNETTVGTTPRFLQSDGADLWVPDSNDSTVSRVRGSDARVLETWTGAAAAFAVAIAFDRVLVAGETVPGSLYAIDPRQAAGAVTTVASNLGSAPVGIAFDGLRAWTANEGLPGSVSIITPGPSIPWTVTTVTVGVGGTSPFGILYDGTNVWVTDRALGTLLKLDAAGGVLQTVTVGVNPDSPVFDGTNIWVPNEGANSVTVVRASNGAVLQTLTGNGLSGPAGAGFDGERVLVTNFIGNSLSLFKAADLSSLASVSTGVGTKPEGVCSDGIRFWVTLVDGGKLVRF